MVTLKITVPAPQDRTWKTLDDVETTFSKEEIVQIVHRYCDAQDHAKRYRVNRAARIKMMEAQLAEMGVDVKEL